MENCPICETGKTLTKISSAGEETYCTDCRRIVTSDTLGFRFAASGDDGITECKGPNNEPGFKGPGKKARCFVYTEGNKEETERARKKAKDSAYASQHRASVSRIINATAYFTGGTPGIPAPAPAANAQSNKTPASSLMGNPLAQGPQANPKPPMPMNAADASLTQSAPGGMQNGNLNGPNPLNSGTTASARLNDLISEEMGNPFCTKHNIYHECNEQG